MPNPRLQDYNATFRRELERLNPHQREAVNRTEGPVMVLAGPGTGKTHLLAARIGNILLETDAGAHNILCLTFTEAGVKAMRERLLSFIGPEAHRVGIHTFHGFCSQVIQQNLHYFGRPGLEPLSELERIRVIRSLVDELPQVSPLRLGRHDPYHYEYHLRDLFAQIKAENWTTDDLQQRIKTYLKSLSKHPDFTYQRRYKDRQRGDPKTGLIEEETRRMERLATAVELFPAYQQALRKLRRYDYGDMIGWVLRAFHDHPSLLRSYQERYQYLLVDEFQDTNGSQNTVVSLLAAYWDNPNVFIVGDDDQAIYEFQGARLNAMVDFHDRYQRDIAVVTLTDNYRSIQPILDAAGTVIGNNKIRIGERLPDRGIDKQLIARHHLGGAAGIPATEPTGEHSSLRLLSFPDQHHETGYLLHQLRHWHAAGIPWSEMAVIYAKHGQAELLRHLLERSGIPYRSKRRPNVLDGRPVRQLRDLLRYLLAERDRPGSGEYLLYRLLHLRCFGLVPRDLARLGLARLNSNPENNRLPSWRELLHEGQYWPRNLTNPSGIRRVAHWLESAIGSLGDLPLPAFIELVINGSGMLAAILRSPERAESLPHLATFNDFVLREVARRPRLTLAGLLDTLDQMDANRISLPLQSHLDQTEAVLLVTAHSAKGLEFDKVWLLDCSERTWGPGGSSNNRRFKLPDTLTYAGAEDEEEARRRLFFVALTRAKSEVVISWAQRNERDKVQQRVSFVDELVQADGPQIEALTLNADQLAVLTELQLQSNALTRGPAQDGHSKSPALEADAITDLLKDFRLSVSALYAYLDCPLRFFYEKLLRIPDRERERSIYGSALHEALQNFFLRMKRDARRQFPSREELIFNFEVALGKRRGLLSQQSFTERLERGQRELGTYHDRYRSTWPTEVEVEYAIRNAEVDGIPLAGIIDRIDILSDAFVRVVDYKTSTSTVGKMRRPTLAKPYGGDYWRQLTFYKLLYDHRPGNLRRVKTGTISYLLVGANGEQEEASIELNHRDTEVLRKIIREVWDNIQEQRFAGCGEPECDWCRFARELTSEVPEVGTEAMRELDDL